MRHIIISISALLALTACNSVKFSPEAQEQSSAVTPIVPVDPIDPVDPPPVLECLEGDTSWLPAGNGQTACPSVCPDGTRLQCSTIVERELVCQNNSIVESGNTRIASIGSPIGSCPIVVEPPPVTPPTSKLVTESFTSPGPGKADILVILDTTGSMSPDLTKLSKRFANLTSKLGDVDWQVAITNAGVGTGWWDQGDLNGKFMPFQYHKENKRILKSNDSFVDYYFKSTVSSEDDEGKRERPGDSLCNWQPFCTNPNPEPLNALKKSIDLRASDNSAFFRKDAWLVPLIITDADENEDGTNSAVRPQEAISHFTQQLGNRMKGMVGFGIVIKPGDKTCLAANQNIFDQGAGGKYGNFISEFATRTDGLTISLCEADYGPGLSQISERVREKMSFIEIAQEPFEGQVQVTLTPAVPGMTWTRVGRRIQFSKPLPVNTKVEVSYNVKAN